MKGPGWAKIFELHYLVSVAEKVLGVMHTQEQPAATNTAASRAGWKGALYCSEVS